ncbi:MAG TPA: hypothetical protein GX528_10530 [Firmicutes bacterium]|nr:hypothetical protein [Bacillota bacterium]
MAKFFFMRHILAALDSGRVFKKAYSILLKVIAALIAVAGTALWISTWQEIYKLPDQYSYYYKGIIPAGFVIQLFMLALFYSLIHTLLLRAGAVEKLPETGYVITPIFAVTLKLIGEISACLFSFFGLAGGISIWLAAGNVLRAIGLPDLLSLGGTGFAAGLLTIFTGLLGAFASLVIFYYSPELAGVLADIAGNTRRQPLRAEAGGDEAV